MKGGGWLSSQALHVQLGCSYTLVREVTADSVRSTLSEVRSTSCLGGSGGMPPQENF